MARKLTETVKLNLRFSEELRRKLERAAEKAGHSMNAEIIARLEQSFQKQEIRDIVREELRMVNFYDAIMGQPKKEDGQ